VRGKSLILIVLGMMLLASCRRSTFNPGKNPPPGPQYDPRNISRTDSTQSSGPCITIGPDGTVYVAWMDGSRTGYDPFRIYFRYKPPGGDWSDIEILSDSLHNAWRPHIAADPFGNVHLVWDAHIPGNTDYRIYYRMRDTSGEWSSTMVLSNEGIASQAHIGVDPLGVVHVIWIQGFGMKYRIRAVNGSWSGIEAVPVGRQGSVNPDMEVDVNGGVHIVYEGHRNIKYIYRFPSGEWTEPVVLADRDSPWIASVILDNSGNPWVLWTINDWGVGWNTGIICYTHLENGVWTEPDTIPGTRAGHAWPRGKSLYFYNGVKYLLWGDGYFDIFLGKTDGDLSEGVKVTMPFAPPGSPYPSSVLDRNGVLHVVWAADRGDGNWEIFYDTLQLQ